MNIFLLIPISIIWLVFGLVLFSMMFNGLPETKRQKIIFVCFIGPIGVVAWAIDWIINRLKQYYYE